MKKRLIITLILGALVLLGGSAGCVNYPKTMSAIMSRYMDEGGEYIEDADLGIEEE